MSRKSSLRNTIAYTMGRDAVLYPAPGVDPANPYSGFSLNYEAWALGMKDGVAELADREAREPGDRFASLVRNVREGDAEATAEALELLWEKMK